MGVVRVLDSVPSVHVPLTQRKEKGDFQIVGIPVVPPSQAHVDARTINVNVKTINILYCSPSYMCKVKLFDRTYIL